MNPSDKIIFVFSKDVETTDLVAAFFRPRGFRVKCFPSGEALLEETRKVGWRCDVLLTDSQEKEASEVTSIEDFKAMMPGCPVIPLMEEIGLGHLRSFSDLLAAVQAGHCPLIDANSTEQEASHFPRPVHRRVEFVGRNPKFLSSVAMARKVAQSLANVVIRGESGTGKELFARFIHEQGPRVEGPFVAINCAAIPEGLLESELFGHAKGSFTGALNKKIGLFEEAENGTLFLDEIGDLGLPLQSKLLRVLQERSIKRVGENQLRPVNCRVICATHKDLSVEVNEHRFREDLFFRVSVVVIPLPSLRDRMDDLPELAQVLLRQCCLEMKVPRKVLTTSAMDYLKEQTWRGNVRELENSIQRAVILTARPEISAEDLSSISSGLAEVSECPEVQVSGNAFVVPHGFGLPTLHEVTQRYIEYAILKNGGARDRTAKEIGIDRKTLYKRIKAEHPSSESHLPSFIV